MLMMLENVVPEVITRWASRLRQTWCQKVNAASGFNYKAAGTPVKVCYIHLTAGRHGSRGAFTQIIGEIL